MQKTPMIVVFQLHSNAVPFFLFTFSVIPFLAHLLSIGSSPRENVNSQVIKVLEKLIENGFSEYRQILWEYR
jgi:hypothetical protein